MKLRVLLLIFGLSCFGLNAQLSGADSLRIDSLASVTTGDYSDSLKVDALLKWDELVYKYDADLDLDLNIKLDSVCRNYVLTERTTFFLENRAKALSLIAFNLTQKERYFEASKKFEFSTELYVELKDSANIMKTKTDHVESLYFSKQFQKCIEVGKNTLKFADEYANSTISQSTRIQMNIAHSLFELNFLNEGKEYLKKAEALASNSDDQINYGTLLLRIGQAYKELGEYDKSIKYYQNALDVKESSGDKFGKAIILTNLANIYQQFNNFDRAESLLFEALEYFNSVGNEYAQAVVKLNLGVTISKSQTTEAAAELLMEAKETYERLGDFKGMAKCFNNIGYAFHEVNIDSALYYYRQIKDYPIEQIGEYNYALADLNIGFSYFDLEELDSALIALNSAKIFFQEKGFPDKSNRVNLGLHMTHLYKNDILEASDHITETVDFRSKQIRAFSGVQSTVDKKLFIKSFQHEIDLFYSFLLHHNQSGQTDVGLDLALLLKGYLLRSSSAIRSKIMSSDNEQLILKYQEWINIKKEMAESFARATMIDSLEICATKLESEIVLESNELVGAKDFSRTKWRDIQEKLKENEVAVELIVYSHNEDYFKKIEKDKYGAFIIRKESKQPILIQLCEESELEKIIGTFPGNNLSYIEQVYGTKENTKSQLYDLIWKPLEPHLEGIEKVYVSPVGLLHKISFAALAKEQDVYLCDNYEIEMMSSTGNLALAEPAKIDDNSSYTLFGGIDYNSDSTSKEIWSYLDGSLDETKKIEKTLSKAKRDVNYFNLGEATEAQFKQTASESNILHIATHGFFYHDPDEVLEAYVDETESEKDLVFRGGTSGMGVNTFVKSRNPLMRSGLVFAGANDVWNRSSIEGEDGVLTAAEVATIDMRNTELVVLSACETGLGDIKGSEGVYGLQRSFKMAGVKYLIMSLWQVPDKETAEFMTTFYKNLTKSDDIKKAFKETQLAMRKKYDPYYWAAFVLVE